VQVTEHKNRDIEILRAAAVSLVLLSHWAPHALGRLGSTWERLPNFTAAWSGVDLFFCISGFVITGSLLRELDGGPTRFAEFALPFWIRRACRLWPSAWLWAGIPLFLACFFNTTGLFGVPHNTGIDAAMSVLNVANFHFLACLGSQSCGSLTVYWSLSLEEQFYFVFPFLVFFAPRRVLVAVLIGAALSQLFLVRNNAFESTTHSVLWFIRTDAICLGALIALWQNSPSHTLVRPTILRRGTMSVLVTGVLLCALAVAAAPALALSAATGVIAVISAILVWIASYGTGFVFPRIAALEPALLWLGSRSYSLYLIHEVAARFSTELRARIAAGSVGTIAVLSGIVLTIALTILLAELNYRFVETPVRRLGRRMAGTATQRQITIMRSFSS
jgi:peptidoglycan/LPS O-acetylase OafA/YrhL